MLIILSIIILFIPISLSAQPDIQWQYYNQTYLWGSCFGLHAVENGVVALGSVGNGNNRYLGGFLLENDGFGSFIIADSNFFEIPNVRLTHTVATDDGGYVLAGENMYLKMDENFELVWSHTYEVGNWGQIYGVLKSDAGYLISGYNDRPNETAEAFGFLIDDNGDTVWEHTFGDEEDYNFAYNSVNHPEGGFIIKGATQPFGEPHKEPWLMRIDEDGENPEIISWIGSGGLITVFPEGLLNYAGLTIEHFDWDGERINSGNLEGAEYRRAFIRYPTGITPGPGRGGLVCGYVFDVDGNHQETNRRAFFVRFNDQLERLWYINMEENTHLTKYTAVNSPDGSFYFGGTIDSKFWVAKTDPDPYSVQETSHLSPIMISVEPAYPNPFNSRVSISYTLPSPTPLRITLFDTNGRLLRSSDRGVEAPGYHSFSLDATDYPAGSYFVRIEAGGEVEMIKMSLIR